MGEMNDLDREYLKRRSRLHHREIRQLAERLLVASVRRGEYEQVMDSHAVGPMRYENEEMQMEAAERLSDRCILIASVFDAKCDEHLEGMIELYLTDADDEEDEGG